MGSSAKTVAIADFSITPIGLGDTSVGKYVAEAVKAIKSVKGVRYQLTAMGTIIEAQKIETLLEAVKAAHEAVFKLGAKRVESTLRIDDRRDKPRTMEDKLRSVTEYMKKG